MTKHRSLDLSRIIIYAALIVTAARYSGAFLASDLGEVTGTLSEIITGFMVVSGFGMGVLDVVGLGYIADAWKTALPRTGHKPGTRFAILTVFLLSLMISGVGILAPFTVSRVHKASIAVTLPGSELYIWAVLVNIAPYLIVSGLMVATSNILTVPASDAPPTHDARIVRVDAEPVIAPHAVCPHCGEAYRSWAAHLRWKHPEMTKINGKVRA